ncbi:MAG: hypothetical protein FJ029_15115, partial [Actinobacteria bacterium]|nr:hypothetical protein [Actinomycetota bacterium]
LPQPWHNPAAILALHTDEMYYLMAETFGDQGAQRKKGLSATPTTSSDTTPAPTLADTVSAPSPPRPS